MKKTKNKKNRDAQKKRTSQKAVESVLSHFYHVNCTNDAVETKQHGEWELGRLQHVPAMYFLVLAHPGYPG